MARLAAGVALLSVRDGRGFRGVTLTSLVSVSVEPPLILVSLDRLAQTRDLVVAEGRFTVSVLAREHDFLAERFSGRAPAADPLWRDIPHSLTKSGLPVVERALAWVEADVAAVHEAGDHDLVVARVVASGVGRGDPLVLWDREFWTLA